MPSSDRNHGNAKLPVSLGGFRELELIVLGPEPPIQALGIVIEDRLLEGRLVEDALEDVLVLVHALDDGVEERPVEDEP